MSEILCKIGDLGKIAYFEGLHDTSRRSYDIKTLDPGSGNLWLGFMGKWGDSGGEFEHAPNGPLMKK